MRASYDSVDNKLKKKMWGKVNKDITFIQFFHSTPLHSTELFKIFFSLLTLQLLFCKKLVGREKTSTNQLLKIITYFGTENTAFFDSLMMNSAAKKMNILFWFN